MAEQEASGVRDVGHLGDFTTTRRMLVITGLALPIGAVSACVAWALLRLIGLITNAIFYERLDTKLVAPGSGHHNPIVVLLAHECGHLLAGRLVGFRFQFLALGPLLVSRSEAGRVRVGLNREPALFGGAALALPTDDRDLVRRYTWFVAGGPILSVILAVVSFTLLAIVRSHAGPVVQGFLGMTGLLS